jgi:flagellar basal-body rod protein FlgB
MENSVTAVLLRKALDGLSARQMFTAQNIANAGTPGYRPVALHFEAALKAAAPHGAGAINAAAFETSVSNAPAGEMRLDLELARASQTAMRYGALVEMLGRHMTLKHAALKEGGR